MGERVKLTINWRIFCFSIIFFIIFPILLCFPKSLLAKPQVKGHAELLNPKAYSMGLSTTIFQTTSYYDIDSVERAMAEDSSYRQIDLDFKLSYGLSKNFEVTGFGKLRSVSSTLNTVTASNTSGESLGLEAKYAFESIGYTKYALGLFYLQTLYTNATYDSSIQVPNDEIVLGDSGSEYGINFYLTHNPRPLKWNVSLGYASPGNNLSQEIRYQFECKYELSSVFLFAGIEGIFSLKKDQFSETPNLKPLQSKGASNLYNSINRQKNVPYLGLNYPFEKVILSLKGSTVLSGTSTDKGNSIQIGLDFSTEGITADSVKIESFKEYIVDGSILKVSARGNFIKIDQGLSTDVEKGMKFDIYQTDYFGGNVLVASGIVYEIGADWSVIKLTKKFNEIVIKPGFAARGY